MSRRGDELIEIVRNVADQVGAVAESRYTSMTLGQYPKSIVRLVCSRCDRKGQYRKETLIAPFTRFGPASLELAGFLDVMAKCR
jgi:hypothetical protein